MNNVIYYGDLLNLVFCKLMQGSKSEKDIKLFKKLNAWQLKEFPIMDESEVVYYDYN